MIDNYLKDFINLLFFKNYVYKKLRIISISLKITLPIFINKYQSIIYWYSGKLLSKKKFSMHKNFADVQETEHHFRYGDSAGKRCTVEQFNKCVEVQRSQQRSSIVHVRVHNLLQRFIFQAHKTRRQNSIDHNAALFGYGSVRSGFEFVTAANDFRFDQFIVLMNIDAFAWFYL